MSAKPHSPALALLLAAAQGAPKSLGDRKRIALLDATLKLAIQNRFSFGLDDGPELKRLGIDTCVGIFNALHSYHYAAACSVGGTYPRMWERYHSFKPWLAAKAIYNTANRHRPETEDGRIYEGIPFLLPASFHEEEPVNEGQLSSVQGFQVWWCTSFKGDDEIRLCRYQKETSPEQYVGLRRPGTPVRKRSMTRDQWNEIQQSLRDAEALAIDQKAA